MQHIRTITTNALCEMLSAHEALNIIDIRPMNERAEWHIPGSIHVDVYAKLKENDAGAFDNIHLDKSTPIITVCAGGKTSQVAADFLQQKGYKAFSLQDGMKGWSLAWNAAYQKFKGFEIWQIRRTGKGCLSYIIASEKEAIIIDASLPLDVYAKLVNQHHLSVKYVIETHIHADHLSRSKEISGYFKAPLYLPLNNKVQFPYDAIEVNTVFHIGSVNLQCIPTPGHTLESYSFHLENNVVFTGDTIFVTGVGRPDLKANAEEIRTKGGLLYHSLKKLLSLPEDVLIFPAHTNKPVDFDGAIISTTIGQARKNMSLHHISENDFVNELLQKIPPTPANYLSIVDRNLAGEFSDAESAYLEVGANRCAIPHNK